MATIGGVSCDILRGTINNKRERVVVDHPPGANSPTLQKLGLGDGTFELTAVEFGTDTEIETWLDSIEALQSAIVTIIDDRDDTWTQRVVEQVGNRTVRAIIQPGTSNTSRGEIQLRGKQL